MLSLSTNHCNHASNITWKKQTQKNDECLLGPFLLSIQFYLFDHQVNVLQAYGLLVVSIFFLSSVVSQRYVMRLKCFISVERFKKKKNETRCIRDNFRQQWKAIRCNRECLAIYLFIYFHIRFFLLFARWCGPFASEDDYNKNMLKVFHVHHLDWNDKKETAAAISLVLH